MEEKLKRFSELKDQLDFIEKVRDCVRVNFESSLKHEIVLKDYYNTTLTFTGDMKSRLLDHIRNFVISESKRIEQEYKDLMK